jgi:hypothetical protein
MIFWYRVARCDRIRDTGQLWSLIISCCYVLRFLLTVLDSRLDGVYILHESHYFVLRISMFIRCACFVGIRYESLSCGLHHVEGKMSPMLAHCACHCACMFLRMSPLMPSRELNLRRSPRMRTQCGISLFRAVTRTDECFNWLSLYNSHLESCARHMLCYENLSVMVNI